MRLDKFLCDAGIGTRSEVKKLLKKGIVTVNDNVIKQADTKINEDSDIVKINDDEITYQKNVYFMLYKPSGYISATVANVPTVLDLVPAYKDLFPCGRLDKDTEGLLLITNDGPLAHNLLSPKKHVEKEYYVECEKPITEETVECFQKGITLKDGTVFASATCVIKSLNSCHVILHEGKYHEIKRMFESQGNRVTYLKRIRMKDLWLDETLLKGEYRPLTDEELQALKKDDHSVI